jgi:hypothetical protein
MVATTDAQVQAAPVKKLIFTIKKSKNSKKSKKEVDPLKVNVVQVLQRIAFTKVDDRFLMNAEDINKDDSLRCLVGFDSPTTCQLNLNYLYCKAIACMDKRMSAIEKQVKILSGESEPVKQACDKKRKRGADKKEPEIVDLCAEDSQCQTVFQDSEDKYDEKEPGEITMDDAAKA